MVSLQGRWVKAWAAPDDDTPTTRKRFRCTRFATAIRRTGAGGRTLLPYSERGRAGRVKAVVCEKWGEPEQVLHVRDVPAPTCGSGQVRVRMLASPVNP